jgi:hypothetical protein
VSKINRTHRQRHQVYLEMLEKEVFRLREYEKSCKVLQDQLSDLCRHLSYHTIAHPLAQVGSLECEHNTVAIPDAYCAATSNVALSNMTADCLNINDSQCSRSILIPNFISDRNTSNSLLCIPQVGIDFVLM